MFLVMEAALACGGFACQAGPVPVIQNAERIAFGIDPVDGMVEAHVQVFYEGDPDAFAWVIPVAAEPEVFISTDALFTAIDQISAPVFTLQQNLEGSCFGGGSLGCRSVSFLQGPAAPEAGLDGDGGFDPFVPTGVEVTGSGSVGPYDYLVLDGSSTTAVVDFLIEQEFDVVPELADTLAPYLTPGSRFLAIRLQKDSDVGDVAPIGFRYPGDTASVPLQLTAIAAAPDMGVQVNVFAPSRAVPSNYLHAVVNEEKIDWFNNGANYYDVVGRAVDQAGGRAFVTDFSGDVQPLDPFSGNGNSPLWWDDESETQRTELLAATTPGDWLRAWNEFRQAPNESFHAIFEGVVSFDENLFGYRQLQIKQLEGADLAVLSSRVDDLYLQPMKVASELFELGVLTRMSTSLDPSEMTVDPMFVLNDTLGPVSNTHTAILDVDCRGNREFSTASRQLTLEDGRSYALRPVSEEEVAGEDLMGLTDIDAIRVEQLYGNEPTEILVDNFEAAQDATSDTLDGRGCAVDGAPVGFGILAGLVGVVMRRRQR